MSGRGAPRDCDRVRLEAIARHAMVEAGLAPDFPAAALAEAGREAPDGADDGLPDLRDLPWCSIDNDTSRDLDQLTVATVENGMARLRIAVADVAARVTPGSAVDDHARANTVSVYTPAHVFPMLPEALSFDRTSLLQDRDRTAWVIDLPVDGDGRVHDARVVRARVRNRAQLVYGPVGAWLEGRGAAPAAIDAVPGLADNLRVQDGVATRLRALRHEAGALEFDTMEYHARLDGDHITALEPDPRDRAKDLIEDLMIAANTAVAGLLASRGLPVLRRVVRAPERWPRIVAIAAEHGATLPAAPDPGALNAFLRERRAADPERFPDLSLSIVKLLGGGRYEVAFPGEAGEPHFGLAVREYTHSTAPNRRYPDLVTQRLLGALLAGLASPYGRDELVALADMCTRKEDAAQKVERRMRKAAAACMLTGHVGELFDGVVTGASPRGTWVRTFHPPVEGRVDRGQEGLDVGDHVRVKLVHTDADRGYIDFARVDHTPVGRRA